jgi:hypothetical protein
MIALSDVSRTSTASNEEPRLVWVDASYNPTDNESLRDVANADLDITKAERHEFRVLEHVPTTLAGVPAIRFKVRYEQGGQQVIEGHVVSLRSGIVYTVALRTLEANQIADQKQFGIICKGFGLLRLPRGQCSNA